MGRVRASLSLLLLCLLPPVSEYRPPLTEPNPSRRRRAFDWSTASIAVLAVAAAVTVYVRDGQAHFFAILREDLWLLGDMTPKVLAGCLIAVFITFLMPREVVVRWVGEESGLLGLIIAAVIGPIVPGGPITIYPIAGAFFAMGADGGAVVAFMTSWTLIGSARAVVWEMPFFGPHFVFWRIVLSLPLPFLAGVLARYAIRAFSLKLGDEE
jgi:uncharacterized membrane protein YraQ (UPF0718 family)